jgi:UDP-N-acetylglucosamine transferase subunit ALG13
MPEPLRLFVVTGSSEFPFDRMVQACVALQISAANRLHTTIQYGASTPPPTIQNLDAFEFVGSTSYNRLLLESNVLVGHAGLGLILDLLRSGLPATLIPRRGQLGEHVDDHQMQISRAIDIDRIDVITDRDPKLTLAGLEALAHKGRRSPVLLGNPNLTSFIGKELGLMW